MAGSKKRGAKNGAGDALPVLSLAARVFLSASIVQWTFQLEREACRCSRSWKRDYVRTSYLADVVLRILLFVLRDRPKPKPLLLAVFAFDVAQFAVLLSYAVELERAECGCSEGSQRVLAFVWPVIYFSFVAMIFSFALMVGAIVGSAK